MFEKDLLLLLPQYKGGILNYELYVVTFVVGRGMYWVLLKKKSKGSHQSLMIWRPWLRPPPLSPQQIEIKNQSNAKIACLLREEEIKWYQRSKSKFILEGDSNTRYFHSVANGRLIRLQRIYNF
jgi:hypothetical protein